MHEILHNLIQHGYTLLFLWVLAERLGIPIPATPPLIAAGILIEMEHMQFAHAVLIAFLAVMLSDFLWFFIGRYRGSQILMFLCRISFEPDACVRGTKNLFEKYGSASLLFVKFIPGLSNLMVPVVGIIRMPLQTFIAFDIIGSLIWVVSFIGVGYFFSREIDLEKFALPDWGQGAAVLALFIVLALYVIVKYLYKQHLLRGLFANRITPEELKKKIDTGEEIAIIDVRHRIEYEADPFMIPGAIHLPLEELKQFSAVSADMETVTYCA